MSAVRRVLLIAPQPFYEDRGTPIAVRQVLQALSELGYEVDILTYPIGRGVEIPGVRVFRVGNFLKIRQVPIGLSLRKLILDAAILPAMVRLLRENRYDCIHAVEEAAFPAVVLGRRYGIPVIYDMQSGLPEQLTKHAAFRLRPVQAILRRCEHWLLTNADLVMCYRGLEGYVSSVAPRARVREWFSFNELPTADAEQVAAIRAELQLPLTKKVVVYTGNFEHYQGIPTLLSAIPSVAAVVPEAVFVLVGGSGGEAEALRRGAKRMGLNGSLRVVERQSRERMTPYLAMADILVSTRSQGGNLPLKIFDYVAAGRPIVATDIPTHRTLLNEERALLVPPNPEAVARGITELLCDRERAEGLAAAARSYADEHLGWIRYLQLVGDAYGQLRTPGTETVGL
ncbi:N/A [soil metagenome]